MHVGGRQMRCYSGPRHGICVTATAAVSVYRKRAPFRKFGCINYNNSTTVVEVVRRNPLLPLLLEKVRNFTNKLELIYYY